MNGQRLTGIGIVGNVVLLMGQSGLTIPVIDDFLRWPGDDGVSWSHRLWNHLDGRIAIKCPDSIAAGVSPMPVTHSLPVCQPHGLTFGEHIEAVMAVERVTITIICAQ